MSRTTLSWRPGAGLPLDGFFEPWNEFMGDGLADKMLTVPKVNVRAENGNYLVEVAAPGMDKNDFNIDVSGNILTVSAKKEDSTEDKKKNYMRKEYNYSSFSRSFTLPDDVLLDKIEAHYEDGILKLALPKNGKVTAKNNKEIPIK